MPTATGGTGPYSVGSIVLKKMGTTYSSGTGDPTDGTSGTLAGKIAIGGFYVDRVTGNQWRNIGTKASPLWTMPDGVLRVPLTFTQIRGMNASPVTIIPAAGANRAISVKWIQFTIVTTATAYANGGVVTFPYHGTSNPTHQSSIPAATITAGAGTSTTLLSGTATNGTVASVNTAVDITNGTAPFITGTGTAIVVVNYSVVATL